MRTLIDLPDHQIAELAEIAKHEKVSRAALIRQAVADLLAAKRRKRGGAIAAAFGIRPEMGDGLVLQERLRGEW
jgi:metal-responsive CopG/Arc/MetJ family transcriptional regulator